MIEALAPGVDPDALYVTEGHQLLTISVDKRRLYRRSHTRGILSPGAGPRFIFGV